MIEAEEVKRQLAKVGAHSLMWGRAEMRELPHILLPGEQINHILNGRYEGGFAILCATDQRVILIDKKPFFLTLEDTRYEMISDVQFNHRLIDASLWLGTVHKRLVFRAYNHAKLRGMTSYIQQQVMASRQQYQQQIQQPAPIQQSEAADPAQPILIETILATTQRPPINPYKTPLIVRHRVSRFY